MNLYANENTRPDCSLKTIVQIEADILAARTTKKLPVVLNDSFNRLDNCRTELYPTANADHQDIKSFYRVINTLLDAQLKTNKINECLTLGAAVTEPWDSTFSRIKTTANYSAINTTLLNCHKKRDQELGYTFTAQPCALFSKNHKYSSAIAISKPWGITTAEACLYLDGGKNRSKPEEEGIPLIENNPHLILFTQTSAGITEKIMAFNQGVFAGKNLCLSGRIDGVNFIAVGGDKTRRLVRIRSFAEHCVRDSIALKLDGIYQLGTDSELIPANELSIILKNN